MEGFGEGKVKGQKTRVRSYKTSRWMDEWMVRWIDGWMDFDR